MMTERMKECHDRFVNEYLSYLASAWDSFLCSCCLIFFRTLLYRAVNFLYLYPLYINNTQH